MFLALFKQIDLSCHEMFLQTPLVEVRPHNEVTSFLKLLAARSSLFCLNGTCFYFSKNHLIYCCQAKANQTYFCNITFTVNSLAQYISLCQCSSFIKYLI